MGDWPSWCDGLMNTTPGSIKRRFPTYWYDGEGGIDWGVKPGEPITALADGVIAGAGYFCHDPANYYLQTPYPCKNPDYGVVTTRVTNADGTQTDIYYQHIVLANNIKLCDRGIRSCGGQTVKKGDVIGYGNPGGFLEVGINVGNSSNPPPWPNGWGGIWGADKSPGPHVDPEPYLRNLISNYGSTLPVFTLVPPTNPQFYTTPFLTIAENTQKFVTQVPGFAGIVLALDNVEQFQAWQLPSDGKSDSPILGGIAGGISAITGSATAGTSAAKVGKLPSDAIQATLVFVVSNTAAFLVRALIVMIGFLIISTLIRNILGITPQNVMEVAKLAGEFA